MSSAIIKNIVPRNTYPHLSHVIELMLSVQQETFDDTPPPIILHRTNDLYINNPRHFDKNM